MYHPSAHNIGGTLMLNSHFLGTLPYWKHNIAISRLQMKLMWCVHPSLLDGVALEQ
jgi:hypothetical protein